MKIIKFKILVNLAIKIRKDILVNLVNVFTGVARDKMEWHNIYPK